MEYEIDLWYVYDELDVRDNYIRPDQLPGKNPFLNKLDQFDDLARNEGLRNFVTAFVTSQHPEPSLAKWDRDSFFAFLTKLLTVFGLKSSWSDSLQKICERRDDYGGIDFPQLESETKAVTVDLIVKALLHCINLLVMEKERNEISFIRRNKHNNREDEELQKYQTFKSAFNLMDSEIYTASHNYYTKWDVKESKKKNKIQDIDKDMKRILKTFRIFDRHNDIKNKKWTYLDTWTDKFTLVKMPEEISASGAKNWRCPVPGGKKTEYKQVFYNKNVNSRSADDEYINLNGQEGYRLPIDTRCVFVGTKRPKVKKGEERTAEAEFPRDMSAIKFVFKPPVWLEDGWRVKLGVDHAQQRLGNSKGTFWKCYTDKPPKFSGDRDILVKMEIFASESAKIKMAAENKIMLLDQNPWGAENLGSKPNIPASIKWYSQLPQGGKLEEGESLLPMVINPINLETQYRKHVLRREHMSEQYTYFWRMKTKLDDWKSGHAGLFKQLEQNSKFSPKRIEKEESKLQRFRDVEMLHGNARVHDLTSLMRKVFYSVMAFQGLVLREFITTDKNWIAATFFCPEVNLKKIAATMGMNKELDLGVSDLLSLEPIDKANRPYRMHPLLYDSASWEKNYPEPLGSYNKLAAPILELLGEWQYIKGYQKNKIDEEEDEPMDLESEIKDCRSCAERQRGLVIDEGKLKEKRLHRKICQVEKNANVGPFYYGVSMHIMTKMNLDQPRPLGEDTRILGLIKKFVTSNYSSENVLWEQEPFPLNVYSELDLGVTEGDREGWEEFKSNPAPAPAEKLDQIAIQIAKMINEKITRLYRGLCSDEAERFSIIDWMRFNDFPSKGGVDHIDFNCIDHHDYGVKDTLYKHSLHGRPTSQCITHNLDTKTGGNSLWRKENAAREKVQKQVFEDELSEFSSQLRKLKISVDQYDKQEK
jgi:hypothetical protein